MNVLGPEAKQRISTLVSGLRVAVQWGFIPTVLYLGFKKGADEGQPPLSLLSLLWQ
ncbi:mitochondrial import receptor subunit TOM7 homolog [Babylonia areolata]|uniref:mitochondrial import receptor subunit TOM7 homolog n=1 Tax=Babylonia areolata TaxID=304850 RepID=UPI003FD451FC